MNKNIIKATVGFCTIVGISVIGHHTIMWGQDRLEKLQKKVACEWLSKKLLSEPSEQIKGGRSVPELIVLEAHCWKSNRVATLTREVAAKRKG